MKSETVVEARKLIRSGAIGVPTFSQTSYCRNSKDGEWNYRIDADAGPDKKGVDYIGDAAEFERELIRARGGRARGRRRGSRRSPAVPRPRPVPCRP